MFISCQIKCHVRYTENIPNKHIFDGAMWYRSAGYLDKIRKLLFDYSTHHRKWVKTFHTYKWITKEHSNGNSTPKICSTTQQSSIILFLTSISKQTHNHMWSMIPRKTDTVAANVCRSFAVVDADASSPCNVRGTWFFMFVVNFLWNCYCSSHCTQTFTMIYRIVRICPTSMKTSVWHCNNIINCLYDAVEDIGVIFCQWNDWKFKLQTLRQKTTSLPKQLRIQQI